MKGANVGFDLVLKFGLGHQHTGHKGTERQRQARQFSQPCQAQCDQQKIQHEELFALSSRHQGQPRTHDFLTTHQQHRQQHHGLEQGDPQGFQHLLCAAVQGRDQHQQRHNRQVLKQQHAQHAAPMFAFQL